MQNRTLFVLKYTHCYTDIYTHVVCACMGCTTHNCVSEFIEQQVCVLIHRRTTVRVSTGSEIIH